MKFGVITRTWQALIKVLVWGYYRVGEDEQLWSCKVVFVCAHPRLACGAQLSGPQGLTVSCAALLLFPWAKSILSRAGETGDIASIIYLTSFAQNCLLCMLCALCSVPSFCWAQVTWYLSLLLTASECLVLVLHIPLCCWGRPTAPHGEP